MRRRQPDPELDGCRPHRCLPQLLAGQNSNGRQRTESGSSVELARAAGRMNEMWMAAFGHRPISVGTAKLMTSVLATPTIAPSTGLNVGGRNGGGRSACRIPARQRGPAAYRLCQQVRQEAAQTGSGGGGASGSSAAAAPTKVMAASDQLHRRSTGCCAPRPRDLRDRRSRVPGPPQQRQRLRRRNHCGYVQSGESRLPLVSLLPARHNCFPR